jgi:hypothetical protein
MGEVPLYGVGVRLGARGSAAVGGNVE